MRILHSTINKRTTRIINIDMDSTTNASVSRMGIRDFNSY